jgi:biopolymer transport protein ExbD
MGALDMGGGAKKKKGGRRRPQRRGKIRIDMTPMVDVAFLLLIFFMVTTVFRRPQALEITLPPEESAQIEVPEENVLQIRITEDGKVYWSIGLEAPEAIELGQVHGVVQSHRDANAALCGLIKIDRKAQYHWMVDVLDEVTLGNLNRYSLAPFTEDDRVAIEEASL